MIQKKTFKSPFRTALLTAAALMMSACSLVRYQPIATINQVDLDKGYRFTGPSSSIENDKDDTYIVVMFSGGGTRAAAFGYGVLEQLNRQKVNIGGRERTLMQEVDTVIGVSGGSVLAAYFSLHGQDTIPSFDRRFLRLNFQKQVARQVFSFANLPRLTSPEYGRGDLLQEQFETHLFGKATFADLEKRRKGPFAIISATDMGLGERINFTQEYFDQMCTNLGDLRIARAVAASSAVPMVFAPVTLNNNGGNCNYTLPKDVAVSVSGQNTQQDRTRQEFVSRYRQYDSKTRPYIHLIDGGLTDNLGMRSLLDMADVYSTNVLARRMTDENIRRAVIISVNARNRLDSDIDTKAEVPGLRSVLNSIIDIPIDRYSQESLRRMRAFTDQWNEENKKAPAGKQPVSLSFISLSLDDLPKSQLRTDVLNIPTSFYLMPEDIAKLRTAATILMNQSPEYQKLLAELSAKPTGSSSAYEPVWQPVSRPESWEYEQLPQTVRVRSADTADGGK